MKTLIALTTYDKPDILEGILTSIEEFGYHIGNRVVVADDKPGQTLEVCKKFPFVEAYMCGDTRGIGKNKNRCLRFFHERAEDCEACLLLDHDILFTKHGYLEQCENAWTEDGQAHSNGYVIDADGNDGLRKTFPTQAESEYLTWANGCHGIALWFTRELLKKVGYIESYPTFYGYEHSDISTRALMVQGFCPILYPTVKRSTKFFKLNPNDYHKYDVNMDDVYGKNSPVFHAHLEQTIRGINLKNPNHGLDFELTLSRDKIESMSMEEVEESLRNGKKSSKSPGKSKKKKKH